MRRQVQTLIFCTYLGWASAWAAGAIDSGFLSGVAPSPTPVPEKTEPRAPAKVDRTELKLQGEQGPEQAGDPATTLEKIKAINLIIKNGSSGAAADVLLLNRASAINLYVRQTILAGKTGRLDPRGKQLLEQAIKDGMVVATSPTSNPELRLKARRVVGFSYVYLDQPSQARDQFIEVLKTNPRTDNAGWLALFIAEDFFEAGRFQDAISYYKTFFPLMSEEQKALSFYKIAWAYINLGQSEEARKLFVRLTARETRLQIAKDSLRDLAYLVSSEGSEEKINQTLEDFAQHPKVQLDFLRLVQAALESQNARALHSKVLVRLLPLETDPEKHLRLLIANMRLNRVQYATRAYIGTYSDLRSYVISSKIGPRSPSLLHNHEGLDVELKLVMKAVIETYTGKIKSPDEIAKKDLAEALINQLDFYEYVFPQSPAIALLLKLKLDLCIDQAEWVKVDSVAERIQRDPSRFGDVQEKAAIDQLAALSELVKTEKDPLWIKRRSAKIRIFVDKWPNSPQWIRVAKNHAENLIEAGDHRNALVVLEKIFAKEPNIDNLQRALYSRFKVGGYQEVIDDKRESSLGKTPDPRIADLKRESSLTLAQEARKSGDFATYSRHLKNFLGSSPDPAKSTLARQDFFSYLLSKNLLAELTSELVTFPPKTRVGSDYNKYLTAAWSANMENANFKDAYRLVSDIPEMSVQSQLAKVASDQESKPAELKALPDPKRVYILGLLALTRPSQALGYFNAYPAKLESDRDIVSLALRIQTQQWMLKRTPESLRLLGSSFKFADPDQFPLLPLESRMAKTQVPAPDSKAAQDPRTAERIFGEVRRMRVQVVPAGNGKPAAQQLRLFRSAQNLEQSTGAMILGSKIPSGLDAKQSAEYLAALQGAAEEFTKQAEEFGKMAEKVEQAVQRAATEQAARTLAQPNPQSWPWPSIMASEARLQGIKKAMSQKNFLGALLLLDLLHEEIIKDDASYFIARTGLLLSFPPNEALRRYLFSELEHASRTDVLDLWRGQIK